MSKLIKYTLDNKLGVNVTLNDDLTYRVESVYYISSDGFETLYRGDIVKPASNISFKELQAFLDILRARPTYTDSPLDVLLTRIIPHIDTIFLNLGDNLSGSIRVGSADGDEIVTATYDSDTRKYLLRADLSSITGAPEILEDSASLSEYVVLLQKVLEKWSIGLLNVSVSPAKLKFMSQ